MKNLSKEIESIKDLESKMNSVFSSLEESTDNFSVSSLIDLISSDMTKLKLLLHKIQKEEE